MKIEADSVSQYLEQLPPERKDAVQKLREVILKNIPSGFREMINYGMIGYVIPHSRYPEGYHCDPKLPLPFMNIAAQKNFVAVYHMGIYNDKDLMNWFVEKYQEECGRKPDMGKSCIRFKKPAEIPFQLIGELASKITANEWIEVYESGLKK